MLSLCTVTFVANPSPNSGISSDDLKSLENMNEVWYDILVITYSFSRGTYLFGPLGWLAVRVVSVVWRGWVSEITYVIID